MSKVSNETIAQQAMEMQIENYRKSQAVSDAQMRIVWQTRIDGLTQQIADLKKNLPIE